MSIKNYKKAKFHGAICPSIIPFTRDGKIDLHGLEKHFKRLTDSGINGILLMGTIGEFVNMSIAERILLIKEAKKMTHLPVIAHISTTVMDDMLKLADVAFENHYDAVMALPPYYYAQTANQLLEYYQYLDTKLSGDWLIYNFPARTGCDVDASLVSKLIERCPNFIGIKDTVDCSSHTRAIVRTAAPLKASFSVLAGFDEYFVPNLMNGGAGVLSGLNNVVPEIFAQIMTAYDNDNLSELAQLHQEIGRLSSIYTIGDDFVTTIKTTVSEKFDYMLPHSRNFGGQLNAQQLEQLKLLFNLNS